VESPLIVGRDRELVRLAGLLDQVGAHGAALALTGAAGIGKSALLDHTRQVATGRGMVVLSTTGVPVETNFPFAGLHRLLRPLLAHVDALPAVQRDAVRAAFGMGERTPPEPFMIALGVLGLLTDAATRTPVLLCVEDAHWLDRPTADALAFLGRRIESDQIVLLAALRTGYDSPLICPWLTRMELNPLTDEASRQLLDQVSPGLTHSDSARVLTAAEGNPLALRELPATFTSSTPTVHAVSGVRRPLNERLEEAFAARVTELPAPARTLVRVAAAAEDAMLATILEGAEIIDGEPRSVGDLIPAVRARLVEIEGRQVRFQHPLMRSAIYQAATVAERQAAHAALVEVYAENPDRRVWHRLAAATGPDRAVCTEAEEAARRALQRGAAATAAVVFERAAAVAPGPARRGRLLLEAAAAASDQGHGDTVIRLLAEASLLDLGPHERALWMWLEDGFRPGPVGDAARVTELMQTATRMAELGDRDLALNLLVAAASRCHWGALRAEGLEVVRVADSIGAVPGDQRMLYIQVFAAPIERTGAVLRGLGRSDGPDDAAGLYLRGIAVCMAGAFDQALPLLAASAARLRAQGRLHLLAQVLSIQAWAALEVGDLAVAMPAAQESQRLAVETQRPLWETSGQIAEAAAAAMRGDQRAVQTLTAAASRVALPIGAAALVSLVQYARGLLELGRGRYTESYEQLRRIREPGDAASHHLTAFHTIGDFTEAAVGSGHREEAATFVRQSEILNRLAPSPWLHVQLTYARLLLAADDDAEPLFEDALGENLTAWPLWRARVELAYGKWLRRRRRQLESRAPLRSARDAFDALGAAPWAEQAHQELRAAGESSTRRRHDGFDELTPQELQVAQMVVQGLTNRAIAQRLYLSHRTIESHLYRMFPKLGVSSRAELVTVVRDRLDPAR